MTNRMFWKRLVLIVLLGMSFNVASATDMGDEVVADIDGVIVDDGARVVSLPTEFTLEGEHLLVTGYAPQHEGMVRVRLVEKISGDSVAAILLPPDERGIFSGLWDLRDVCEVFRGEDFSILVNDTEQHAMHLTCSTREVLSEMQFAGAALQGAPYLQQGSDAIFEAIAPPGIRLYSVYSSVVHARDLYSEGTGRQRVRPWQPLEYGNHTLTIMPHDPVRKILYEPIVIPFTLGPSWGENLQATVYYAPGGIAIIGFVVICSIAYIRHIRALQRGIALWDEEEM